MFKFEEVDDNYGVDEPCYRVSRGCQADIVYWDDWSGVLVYIQDDSGSGLPDDAYDEESSMEADYNRYRKSQLKGEKHLEFNDDDKHVNEAGGTQTRLPVRCDLLPPETILRASAVLAEGADKYGENNWQLIDVDDHINHALTHLFRYLSGDRAEPHLAHAVCRCLFADWTHHHFTQEQLDKDSEDESK